MGLTGFMLSLYKWDRLSDQSLVEMLDRVRMTIDRLVMLEIGCAKSSKDMGKAFEAEWAIMAEMDKRGIPYVKRDHV